MFFVFFFFNDTATTEIYTLSLHDLFRSQTQKAPPQPSPKATAWAEKNSWFGEDEVMTYAAYGIHQKLLAEDRKSTRLNQSHHDLVCRLLLEKKK